MAPPDSTPEFTAKAVVAGVLLYEHSIVRADDLSRVNRAFFDLNGIVSLVYLAAVLGSQPWSRS